IHSDHRIHQFAVLFASGFKHCVLGTLRCRLGRAATIPSQLMDGYVAAGHKSDSSESEKPPAYRPTATT
ncbi:hypothetical protein, partial [Bradyrhizobium guangzhouense]|uniref:hypothetical protein n=1 Tax=Bradyrhizobium guangzhouense TaxID=1325095 RepID=UPI0019D6FE2F